MNIVCSLVNAMPFNKRTVEPIHLSQVQVPHDTPNELECVANHTLANVIRQLSSLSAHAQDLLDELITDASHILQRTEVLNGRIERLKSKVTQLDANAEEGVTIEDVHHRKPFVSGTRIDQQVVNRATMPKSLHSLYEQAEPAPALHLLNPYRDDGRDSMKFYTDPQFFFNLWMQSMMPSAAVRKAHYQESIYATQARLPRQTSDDQQQYRSPRAEYGEIARANSRPLLQYPNNHYQPSDLVQYGSPTLSSGSSYREQQSLTMNFSSTGTPSSPLNVYNNNEPSPRLDLQSPIVTRQAPLPPPPLQLSHNGRSSIARPSATPPPPPPPPPPPQVRELHSGIATLATISEIDHLPPPPADFIEQLPLPPPPPPLTNACSQRDDVSETSDQRPVIRRDLHSDLLGEIKKGIQLNNRKKEEEKKGSVTSKSSSLNVMAIMEQAAKYRRDKIRPQSESDNDEESSRWDDSD